MSFSLLLACGSVPLPYGDVLVLLSGSVATLGHEVSLLVSCRATFGKGLAAYDDGSSWLGDGSSWLDDGSLQGMLTDCSSLHVALRSDK